MSLCAILILIRQLLIHLREASADEEPEARSLLLIDSGFRSG